MHRSNVQLEPVFGFLSTLETTEYGYFGGYLVVNALGRPLEFHCTAPVRPNRAQEILYGPTLQPYLLGEQMGGALLREAKLKPDVVLTDQSALFCLRQSLVVPLAMVAAQAVNGDSSSGVQLHAADDEDCAVRFLVSGHEIQLPDGFESDQAHAVELLEILAKHVDLAEPFDRIREAIREASRIGERDQELYDQAAA